MNCSKKSETKGSVTRKIFCVVVILGLAAAAGLSFYSCDQLWPPDEGPGDTNENPPGDDVTPAPGQESPGPTGESSSVPTGGATDVSTPAPTDIATPVPDSVFYFEGDTLVIVSPDGIQLRFRAENGWTYNAGESRYEAYGIVYLGTPFGEIEMEVEILIAAPDPLYIGATVVEFPFPKFRFLLDSDFQMPVTTLAIASGSELNADDIGIPLMDDRLYLLFTYENGEDFEFSFLDVSVSRENGDAYQGTIIFDVADPMFYVEGDVYGLSCLENKGVEDIGIGISTQALIPVASSYELYNGTSWKTYTVDSHLYGKGTIPFNIKGIPFECEGNVGINADANGDGTFLGFSDDTGFLDDIAFCTNALLRISPEKYGFTFSLDIGAGSAVYDNDEGKLMFHGRSLKNRLFELIEPVQHHDFQIYGYYDVDTDDLYFKAEGSVFNLIQGYELRNATLEFYNGKVTLSGDLRFGENFVHVSGSVSSNGDCELKGTGRWNFFGYELGNATVVFSKRGEAVSFQGEGMVDVGPLDVRVNGSIGPDGSYLLSYRDELILAGYTLRNVEVNFSGNITSAQLALDVTVRIGDAYVRFSGNVATDGTFGFRNTNSFKVGGYSLSDVDARFGWNGSGYLTLDASVGIGNASVRFSGNVATDGTFGFRNTNSFKVGGYSLSDVDARFGWNGSGYLTLDARFGIGKTSVRFSGNVKTDRSFSFTSEKNIEVGGYDLTRISVTFSANKSSASISGSGRITVGTTKFESDFDVDTGGGINDFEAKVSKNLKIGIDGANVEIEGSATLTIDDNEVEIEFCGEACATLIIRVCSGKKCVSVDSHGRMCFDIPLIGEQCSLQIL